MGNDARIGVFSRHLSVILNNPKITKEEAVMQATLEYNQGITNLNWSPAEIFTGRQIGTQDLTALELKDLWSRIETVRGKCREATEKFREKKKLKKKLTLIPWKSEALNDPKVIEALREKGQFFKVGDIVKLNLNYGKNDVDRLFVVKDISWAERTFKAQKLNRPKGKVHRLSFDVVAEVLADTIRRISEANVLKQKAITAFFNLYGFDPAETEEQIVVSEQELIHDLDRQNQKQSISDSGFVNPSVVPPSVKPPSPPQSPLQSVKPSQVQEVDSPIWAPETPYTPYPDTSDPTREEAENPFEGYVSVEIEGTGASSKLMTREMNSDASLMDPANEPITPVPNTGDIYTTLGLSRNSDESIDSPNTRIRKEKQIQLEREEHEALLDETYSDLKECRERTKIRESLLDNTILEPYPSTKVVQMGAGADSSPNRDLDITVDKADFDKPAFDSANQKASTPNVIEKKKYKTKITKERDKDSPLLRKGTGAGIMTVGKSSFEIRDSEDLKNFFAEKVGRSRLSKGSDQDQLSRPAPTRSQNDLSCAPPASSNPDQQAKTGGNKPSKPRKRIPRVKGLPGTRKSSRIAGQISTKQNQDSNNPN